MSTQIDTALVNSYRAGITVKFQQSSSRLEQYCRRERQGSEYDYFDRIGTVDPVEVLTRHGDTPQMDTPHDRRRVALRSFDWADYIDRPDRMRMLSDPTSPYTVNAVAGINRRKDDVIIEAALGSAWTGKSGSTEVTFPSTQRLEVNALDHTNSGDNTNLTLAKLRRAQRLLNIAEAKTEGGSAIMVVSSYQLQALLADGKVQSSDYNTVKALVNGEIDTFMGFKFVRSERLKYVAGSTTIRRCFAFVAGQGILLSTGEDLMVEVTRRNDKRFLTQVYVSASFGAVRMWEEQVVEIRCDESVAVGT